MHFRRHALSNIVFVTEVRFAGVLFRQFPEGRNIFGSRYWFSQHQLVIWFTLRLLNKHTDTCLSIRRFAFDCSMRFSDSV
jgi:hypothetical protein